MFSIYSGQPIASRRRTHSVFPIQWAAHCYPQKDPFLFSLYSGQPVTIRRRTHCVFPIQWAAHCQPQEDPLCFPRPIQCSAAHCQPYEDPLCFPCTVCCPLQAVWGPIVFSLYSVQPIAADGGPIHRITILIAKQSVLNVVHKTYGKKNTHTL